MRCAIWWYHLCNLKNVKNTHGGVLILLKLQAKVCFEVLEKDTVKNSLKMKKQKKQFSLQKLNGNKRKLIEKLSLETRGNCARFIIIFTSWKRKFK